MTNIAAIFCAEIRTEQPIASMLYALKPGMLKSFSLQSREVRTHKDGPEALKVAAYQLKNAENAL
jgi:hypothetical protein